VKKPAAPANSSKPASKIAADFGRRAARAELLSREAPAAEGPLRFAAGLYRIQGRVAEEIETADAEAPFTGRLEADVERLGPGIASVIRYTSEEGPEGRSAQARERQTDLPSTARTRLLVYWREDSSSREAYLSRAILRPYAEFLRIVNRAPDRVHRRGRCPFCGGSPWIAAGRDGSAMEGSRRMLGCSLCGGEWLFGRILCPACFEEDPAKLPYFRNEKHTTVRVEACETCHRYVKSLDLSEDARPIPEVDDLVSLSMDLWAMEQGFERIEPGLAGV
jgi:FdhE protein